MPSRETHPTMMDNRSIMAALEKNIFTVSESSGIWDNQLTLVFDVNPEFAKVVNKISTAIVEAMDSDEAHADLTAAVKEAFRAES